MSYMTQINMPKSPQHECTWIYIYIIIYIIIYIHINIILYYNILYYTILYYIILYYTILYYITFFLFILYTYTHIQSYTHIQNIYICTYKYIHHVYTTKPIRWASHLLSRLGVPEFLHQWRSWILVGPCRRMTSHYIYGYGSIPIDTFLMGWTSIYQLFWGSLGTRVLTHSHIYTRYVMHIHTHVYI